MTLMPDGNLVFKDSGDQEIWATQTSGPGVTLTFDLLGRLILNSSYGWPLWSSTKSREFVRIIVI